MKFICGCGQAIYNNTILYINTITTNSAVIMDILVIVLSAPVFVYGSYMCGHALVSQHIQLKELVIILNNRIVRVKF